VLVVRGVDQNNPRIKALVDAYHSEAVKKFILDKYKGAVVAAW